MGTNDEILRVVDLKAFFRVVPALHGITMSIRAKHSTAIIGPSGCGKSTLVRCLNRMHEVIPGATVQGEVWFNGFNIYDPMAHPVREPLHKLIDSGTFDQWRLRCDDG